MPLRERGRSYIIFKGVFYGNKNLFSEKIRACQEFDYPCRYIYGDVGCETLSDIFGVAMQPYEAILRESGDLSINNLVIIVAGSLVITRN